jgi:hypothetical protein
MDIRTGTLGHGSKVVHLLAMVRSGFSGAIGLSAKCSGGNRNLLAWSCETGEPVTCKRCLTILAKMEVAAVKKAKIGE